MGKNNTAVAEAPEVEEDYTKYLEKAPTDLQSRFSVWIKDKTGKTFATKKEESSFDEGVRLGVALRMKFQASPENQEVLNAAKVTRAEAPVAEPKPAKEKKGAKAPEAAPVVAPVEPKAKPAKKAAAKGAGNKAPF